MTECRLALTGEQGGAVDPLVDVQAHREEYKLAIRTLWNNKKTYFQNYVRDDLSTRESTGYVLYNLQGQTNNLLDYAAQEKEMNILDDLAELYLRTYQYLEQKDIYTYYYLPGQQRTATLPLNPPAKMWVYYPPEAPNGLEDILANSQFLFLVGDALNIFLALPENERTQNMNQFIEKFTPVIKDHYTRWVFSPQGMFQVTGWGCTVGMFNARDFLEKKMNREFASRSNIPIGYCNPINDVDMWILTGVVHVLAAHAKNPSLIPLTPQEKEQFLEYVDLGSRALQSRLTTSSLTDFNNNPVTGLNFDLGASDDHPDYAYTAYTGETFPTEANKGYARNRGWDISHATRFVHIFNTLYHNRQVTGQRFPDETVMRGLTNQLMYGAFNKDINRPLFTNFMDGTNGWYRVGYSGRQNFGYPSSDLSLAVFRGGYGLWARFNPDVKKIMAAFDRIAKAKIAQHRQQPVDAEFIAFIDRFYGQPRQTSDSPPDKFHPERSLELLNFWPTLVSITPSEQEAR